MMAVPRFLPKHLGGEAHRVDGGGVSLPMPGSPAALARQEAEANRRRSGAFWESDLRAAADEAAEAMRDFGLSDAKVLALGDAIADAIRGWFGAQDA